MSLQKFGRDNIYPIASVSQINPISPTRIQLPAKIKVPSPKTTEGDTGQRACITKQIQAINNKLSNYKLIFFFDFDCTITKQHTCGPIQLKEGAIIPEQTMNQYIGNENGKKFKEFVADLLAMGKQVAIALVMVPKL